MTDSDKQQAGTKFEATPGGFRLWRSAMAAPFAYAVFGVVWILASDLFLQSLRLPPEINTRIAVAKGWIFVAGSTMLIALLLRRHAVMVGAMLDALQRQLLQTIAAREEADRLSAELERKVDERTRHLESALAELDHFADSVSHDLRAPVRSVAGFSRILREDHGGAMPLEASRLLERIEASTERMNRMIEGLLTLARCGRQNLVQEDLDGPSVDRMVAEIWVELSGLESGRALAPRFRELPGLRCDSRLFETVWRNLIGNALKYTRGRDQAEIDIRFADGWYQVRDNGVGFDPERFKDVFVPFRRYHDATLYEGEGVGLALVRRIVERHGGEVAIDSVEGQGTTVRFRMPAILGA